MKNLKKLVLVVAALGVLGTAGTVYAATLKTPAQITSEVTGQTAEAVTSERASGKTYGTIANEAGKLDEFKNQMLEQRKALLDQQVTDGKLTQNQADEIYSAIKNNQLTCDAAGAGQVGKGYGMRGGNGQGMGMGMGQGYGNGQGRGMGQGYGNGFGTSYR